MALAVFDDTVYVVDPTLGPRVSVFKHDGTFIELRDLEVSGNPTDIIADSAGLVVITPFLPRAGVRLSGISLIGLPTGVSGCQVRALATAALRSARSREVCSL